MKTIIFSTFLLFAIPCLAQDQTTTTTQQTTTMPGGGSVSITVGGNTSTTQQTTVTTTTTNTSQTQAPPLQQQQAPAQGGCAYPMMHEDYESAKTSIAAKDFEDTKLTLAKQIAGSNCMSAEQIRGIMKLFSFENSKLDFAKFAYSHCCDKNNYYKVNDAFTFDSSSTELNNYISNH